jgi:parvulin-like peptidyl-prolyl isomerase
MYRRVALWTMVCGTVFCMQAFAQQKKALPADTLAEIGPRVITAADFLERLELMPWPGKDNRAQHDSAKVKALQSLVAEQLLAIEGMAEGLGTDSLTRVQKGALERLVVRDELYKREVTAKTKVSNDDIAAGMKRYPWQLRLLVMRGVSHDAATQLAKTLAATRNFDSTLAALPPTLVRDQDTLVLTYGGNDWALENAAFALSPAHRLSGAVKTDYLGWVVLYLADMQTNPEFASRSMSERVLAVQKLARRRKEDERATRFRGTVLSPQRAEVDPRLFEKLASHLLSFISATPGDHFKQNGFMIAKPDLDSTLLLVQADRSAELVHIDGGGMTLSDVIEAFRTREFAFASLDSERFRDRLNAVIKDVVASELLTREGLRQNLQYSPNVRHDMNVWTDRWTAAAMERRIRDGVTVSDEEALRYLIQHARQVGTQYDVNVREVLCDSLRQALAVLERLTVERADMAVIAREVSKREAWAKNGGESGFFNVASYPELGFPALLHDTASIGGPVAVPQGYSVFRVLGKKRGADAAFPSPDSLATLASRVVATEKAEGALDSTIGSLAKKHGVTVHYDRLANIPVTPSSMVTKRYIGFGGAMMAVPTIPQMWRWVERAGTALEVVP